MYRKITRVGTIGLAALGLGLGVAAASSATIDTTGPNSDNHITATTSNHADIDNHNTVGICAGSEPVIIGLFSPVQLNRCGNTQEATTGDANVRDNTTGGDATSGDATNDNNTANTVSISNGSVSSDFFGGNGDWDASITNTGPDSDNTVRFETRNSLDVDNDNDVQVNNSSEQCATSGDATVRHNTTGGDATSGDAANTNDTSTEVTVSN
jgi:hypothetical protein